MHRCVNKRQATTFLYIVRIVQTDKKTLISHFKEFEQMVWMGNNSHEGRVFISLFKDL